MASTASICVPSKPKAAKAEGARPARIVVDPAKLQAPTRQEPKPPKSVLSSGPGENVAEGAVQLGSAPSSRAKPTPRQRWLRQVNATREMESFVRPFVRSLVKQLCPTGIIKSQKQSMLLQKLLPTVVSCLVRVTESLGKDSSFPNKFSSNPQKPLIMMAQQLYRKNPKHLPREGEQGTYSYKLISKLLNEELAILAVSVKQQHWAEQAPLMWELFHTFDEDGDSYISKREVTALLDVVNSHFKFGDSLLDADELFHGLDFHRNGLIDFNDFKSAMKQWFTEDQIRLTIQSAQARRKLDSKLSRGQFYQLMQAEIAKSRNDWLVKEAERKIFSLLQKKGYHIRDVFHQLDQNCDGTISLRELANALKSLTKVMNRSDEHVEEDEVDAAITTSAKFGSVVSESVQVLHDYHSNYSADRAPYSSENTVALLLGNSGLDKDGNHKIDLEEFKAWCGKLMSAHGITAARRGSIEALKLARHKLWMKAQNEILQAQHEYKKLNEKYGKIISQAENNGVLLQEPLAAHRDTCHNKLSSLSKSLHNCFELISLSDSKKNYEILLDLAEKTAKSVSKCKIHIESFAEALMHALQLAEELRKGTYSLHINLEKYADMERHFLEIQCRWNVLEANIRSKGHFRGNAFHNVWQCVSMEMKSCTASFQEASNLHSSLKDLPGHSLNSVKDISLLGQLINALKIMESKINKCEKEVKDVQVLAQVDSAADAALRACSIGAMARSITAAVCRSMAPVHASIGVFLRTSLNSATCLSAANDGESSVYTKTPVSKSLSSFIEKERSHQSLYVGLLSKDNDNFGFNSLIKGAIHSKTSFVQPLIMPEHHQVAPRHGNQHKDPLSYIYVSKQGRKAISDTSDEGTYTPLSARICRFVKALGELTSSRMEALEKLDRFVRVAQSSLDLMSCLIDPNLQSFVALRINHSGVRFILGGGKNFSSLPSDISFAKARNCRTIMAAGESENPRTAQLLGECLAWRCGPIINVKGFGILSVVVGVAKTSSVFEAPGANVFRSIHSSMQKAVGIAMQEPVGATPGDRAFRAESARDQRQHFTLLPLRIFWHDHVVGDVSDRNQNGIVGLKFIDELTTAISSGKKQSSLIRDVRKFLGNGEKNYRVDFSQLNPKEFQTRLVACDPSRPSPGRALTQPIPAKSQDGIRKNLLSLASTSGLAVLNRWLAVALLIQNKSKMPTDIGVHHESLIFNASAPSPRKPPLSSEEIDDPMTARQEPHEFSNVQHSQEAGTPWKKKYGQ